MNTEETDIFYDTKIGIRIFMNIGKLYYKEFGTYPMTMTELPQYIAELGFPCRAARVLATETTIERVGITLRGEDVVALILKHAHK